MRLIRTTSDNIDFQNLVIQLDAYLKILDGEDHEFYANLNKTEDLKHVIVCYENDIAIGCGAFKEYEVQIAEIKRMFTLPEHRGNGIAKAILSELENWAKEVKYSFSILETGYLQVDAIHLYTKLGYEVIENFGHYFGVENSVCMKKIL